MADTNQSKNLDCRVVKTVRNLKKDPISSEGSGGSSSSSKSENKINSKINSEEEKYNLWLNSRDLKKTKTDESLKDEQNISKKEIGITSKMNSINKSSSSKNINNFSSLIN